MTGHPQTATERFLRHGVAGGWKPVPWFEKLAKFGVLTEGLVPLYDENPMTPPIMVNPREVLLDPALWEAAGWSLGTNLPVMRCDSPRCDTVQCEYGGYIDPKAQMLGLVEWLWDHPGDVDGYLAQIIDAKENE